MGESPYAVRLAAIRNIRDEARDIKTFTVEGSGGFALDPEEFRPGQFVELTVIGVGEAPFSVSRYDSRTGLVEITVANVGEVTGALHGLEPGSEVGIRGPYGNGFPLGELAGKDLLLMAGGIGMAPLRPLIGAVLDGSLPVRSLTVLYGARTPRHLCFRDEIESWSSIPGARVYLTVDIPDGEWTGTTGPVTNLVERASANPETTKAVLCGPEVMMKVGLETLRAAGWADDNVLLTLERRMECGVGKCGHCGMGSFLVCQEGPVFHLSELARSPEYGY